MGTTAGPVDDQPRRNRAGQGRAALDAAPIAEEGAETWAATHDSAVGTYGEGERAHRTAFAALKHAFEKVGDHWEPKKAKGPSDPQAAGSSRTRRPTAEGVDANASKSHLLDLARRLGVRGRTRWTRPELVDAVKKANRRETGRARERDRPAPPRDRQGAPRQTPPAPGARA